MEKSKVVEEIVFFIEWTLEVIWAFRLMIVIILFGVFYNAQSALVATLSLVVLWPFLSMLPRIFKK